MSWPAVTIRAEARLGDAVALMRAHRIRHLPVLDDDERLVGMLSDRDLRSVLGNVDAWDIPTTLSGPPAATVSTAMTRDPLAVRIDAELGEAARLMDARTIGAVPVLQDEKVIGVLTRGDIVRAFLRAQDGGRHPEPWPPTE